MAKSNINTLKKQVLNICRDLFGKEENDFVKNIKEFVNFSDDLKTRFLEKLEQNKIIVSIVGIVKAGKSSFLNSIFFEGQDIFPKAITPMTTALTILEHNKKNFVEIVYLSQSEFKNSQSAFLKDSNDKLKNILNQAKVYAKEKLKKYSFSENLEFRNLEDLREILNKYTSSESPLAYLVKEIRVNWNLSYLKHLIIVDTPGLNDPVISRSERTKDFIKKSDVVFHLSRASQFFESEDIEMFGRYSLQNIENLYIIASRYDEALKELAFQNIGENKEGKKKKLSLLERLMKAKKENANNRKKDMDKYVLILKEKFIKRLKDIFSQTNIQIDLDKKLILFSTLFLKACRGNLNDEEKEILEKFLEDTDFVMKKDFCFYSGIKDIEIVLKELDKKYKDILKKSKESFISRQLEYLNTIYNEILEDIEKYLHREEEELNVYINLLKELEQKENELREKIRSTLSIFLETFEELTKEVIEHLEEGIENLNVEIKTKTRRSYKIEYVKEKKFCIFEEEKKKRVPVLKKVKYVDVDESIQRAKNLVRKAFLTYKSKFMKAGLHKNTISSIIQTIVKEFFNNILEHMERNLGSNLKKLNLRKINKEILKVLNKVHIPDPLNFNFPEDTFRESLEVVSVYEADEVYKELLYSLLSEIETNLNKHKETFQLEIENIEDNVVNTIKKFLDEQIKFLNNYKNNKEEILSSLLMLKNYINEIYEYHKGKIKELEDLYNEFQKEKAI